MLTLGLEKDLSTPSSSSRLSRVAALMSLPLSAWRIKGWLGTALADALPKASPDHQIGGNLGVFPISHIPGHDFAAPNVDHEVEIEPHTTHVGGQIGDVPTP